MSCVASLRFESFVTIFPDFPFEIMPQNPKIARPLKVPIVMHFLRKVKEVDEYIKGFFLHFLHVYIYIYNTCR